MVFAAELVHGNGCLVSAQQIRTSCHRCFRPILRGKALSTGLKALSLSQTKLPRNSASACKASADRRLLPQDSSIAILVDATITRNNSSYVWLILQRGSHELPSDRDHVEKAYGKQSQLLDAKQSPRFGFAGLL